MDQYLEDELLKNAILIGDNIIEKAIIDSKGIHWKTVKSITRYDDIETSIDETIYTGVSGITLFYIELYKTTKSARYLEYINSSAEWLINYCNKSKPLHGFYAGRMGTVYTLMKAAEVDKPEYYRQKAVEIALQFKNVIDVPVLKFNLLNGIAGTILGLLYLHSEIAEDWILDSIDEGINYLLKHSKSNEKGFYWDVDHIDNISRSTKPLCSLPLGSGGVGLLFLNLSTYFNNTEYKYIARQAFDYENQYLNTSTKNWPDFRIDTKAKNFKRLKNSYISGNYAQFKSNIQSFDWMYGIIGIGLTRLKARDVLGASSSDEFNIVLDKINTGSIDNQLPNYTLAAGKAGLGAFLLELSIELNDKTYLERACKIAREAIDIRAINKFYQFGFDCSQQYEDDGLFMGNAGIGYFYLTLINLESNHLLFPYLSKVSKPSNHKLYQFTQNQAAYTIVNSWYPITSKILGDEKLIDVLSLKTEALKEKFVFEIERFIETSNNSYLKDAFNYDNQIQEFYKKVANNYCLFTVFREVESEKTQNFLEGKLTDDLMDSTFQLSGYTKIIKCKWDWIAGVEKGLNDAKESYYICAPNGKKYPLSKIQNDLLNYFVTPQKAYKGYQKFMNVANTGSESIDYLRVVFLNIIKSFLEDSVLIFKPSPALLKWYSAKRKPHQIEETLN